MNIEIANKAVTPPPEIGGDAAANTSTKGLDFRGHLNGANNAAETTSPATAGTPNIDAHNINANSINVTPTKGVDQANTANSTTKVNGAQIPDRQDMLGQYDQLRSDFDAFLQKSADFDKMVADGKLKSNDPKVVAHRHEEMRTMLHFQSEMQNSSMRVEIVSKVVEHATSGLKTVLSTQA